MTIGPKLTIAFASVAVLGMAQPAHAIVYTLSGNWSDALNPNGVWSYGPGLTHFSQPVTPNAFNSAAANGYWGATPDFFAPPFMVKATVAGSATTGPFGGYNDNDFLAGDVLVHGPNDNNFVSINWTAPGAGTASSLASVWYAHSIVQRSQDVTALFNATLIGSATVTNGITRAAPVTLLNTSGVSVAAGDVISFRFAKSAGQAFGSITGISADIDFRPTAASAVPEPSAWMMMLGGFGLVGNTLRRRNRRTGRSFA